MKSVKKTGMIIVAVALLVMTGIILFHKPEYKVLEKEKTNAAHFYVKAFSLLVWPSPDLYRDFDRKAKNIIDKGWVGIDKDLENILAKNQAAIDEFEKAVKLKKCDLTFGKEYKYLLEKEPRYIAESRKLSFLVMLKGRHYETQQHFDKAINLYLSCLTLAQHVAQDNATLSKGIAMLIEKKSCIPLRQYVDSEKARKEICLNIANYLMKYEKERFSLKEIVEDERKVFDSTVDMLMDDIQKNTRTAVESDPNRKKVEADIAEIRTQSKQLADKYYGGYAKAMESNDEADWKSVQSEVELLRESCTTAIITGDMTKLFNEDFVTPEVMAKGVARCLLSMTIINFQGLAEGYHSNLKELEELRAKANRQ